MPGSGPSALCHLQLLVLDPAPPLSTGSGIGAPRCPAWSCVLRSDSGAPRWSHISGLDPAPACAPNLTYRAMTDDAAHGLDLAHGVEHPVLGRLDWDMVWLCEINLSSAVMRHWSQVRLSWGTDETGSDHFF